MKPSRFLCLLAISTVLAACSALPDKPTRALMYDFGPGPLSAQPQTRQALLPPLAIDDITTYGGAIENALEHAAFVTDTPAPARAAQPAPRRVQRR